MLNPRTSPQSRHFFVAAIVLAVTIWPFGFNLGAYGTVFFDALLQIWAISVAALAAGIYLDRRPDTQILSRVDMAILALPSLWLLTTMLSFADGSALAGGLNAVLTLLTALVAIPHILYLLTPIAMPDLYQVRGTRRIAQLVLLTALITAASFTIGYRNDLFMTCEEFSIAGNAEPVNCRHDPEGFQRGHLRLP